jgi:hypothetical protein
MIYKVVGNYAVSVQKVSVLNGVVHYGSIKLTYTLVLRFPNEQSTPIANIKCRLYIHTQNTVT